MEAMTALERVLGDLQWRAKRCSCSGEFKNVARLYMKPEDLEKQMEISRKAYETAIYDVMTIIEELKQEQEDCNADEAREAGQIENSNL